MATAQVTTLTNGGLTATRPADFSGLTSVSDDTITVQAGGNTNLNNSNT